VHVALIARNIKQFSSRDRKIYKGSTSGSQTGVALLTKGGIILSWDEICLFFIIFYSTNKKMHEIDIDGNAHSTQGQAALTAVTDVARVCLIHNRLLLLHSR